MLKGVIYYLSLTICTVLTFYILYFLGTNYDNEYDFEKKVNVTYTNDIPDYELSGFSGEYAVIKNQQNINYDLFDDTSYAAPLINNTDNECIVAYNAHSRIYPASMTKLMTAIIVCEQIESGNISLDDEVTVNRKIVFTDTNVTASQLEAGCKITVRNLLYGLLIRSYNDYGVILAEYIAGTEAGFADMMNRKAYEIGATNSHFVNSHGLHDDNHYITAYDMYLIINEAGKHDLINQIDSYENYSYVYKDANNNDVPVDITPTNAFLSDRAELPSNIKINTWKTGTTKMAGYCMTMQATISDKEYTIVVADKDSSGDLYNLIAIMFNLTQ